MRPVSQTADKSALVRHRCRRGHRPPNDRGAGGRGGERGPRIVSDRGDLAKLVREGVGTMPQALSTPEVAAVEPFVRPLILGAGGLEAAAIRPSSGPRAIGPPTTEQPPPTLAQINRGNIANLAPRWMYTVKSAIDDPPQIGIDHVSLGAMAAKIGEGPGFVSRAARIHTVVDGREIWHFKGLGQRP